MTMAEVLQRISDQMGNLLSNQMSSFQNFHGFMETYQAQLNGIGEGLSQLYQQDQSKTETRQNQLNKLGEGLSKIYQKGSSSRFDKNMKQFNTGIAGIAGPAFKAGAKALKQMVRKMEVFESTKDSVDALWKILGTGFLPVVERLNQRYIEMIPTVEKIAEKIFILNELWINTGTQFFDNMETAWSNFFASFSDISSFTDFTQEVKNLWNTQFDGSAWEIFTNKTIELMGTDFSGVSDFFGNLKTKIQDWDFEGDLENALTALGEWFAGLGEWLVEKFEEAFAEVETFITEDLNPENWF